jgi:hypothetical protein
MNRMEELAGKDPSSEYYLYCLQTDRLIRREHRAFAPRPTRQNIQKKGRLCLQRKSAGADGLADVT